MVLKLYGVSAFVCTRRVAVVLKEYNVPYELVTINFKAQEHKSEEFLKHQPFGQVPYIVDDGGAEVYESRAIGRYIANKYRAQGPALLPASHEIEKFGKFEQAASVELANFDTYAGGIAAERLYKPFNGQAPDEANVARHLASLESRLDGYEAILSKQKYLAGNEVTLADLFHLPFGSVLENVDISVLSSEKWPNVARWWKDITSRPSWQAVKDGA